MDPVDRVAGIVLAGPLTGLEAGLDACTGSQAIVVASDVPGVSVAVLGYVVASQSACERLSLIDPAPGRVGPPVARHLSSGAHP